MIAASIVRELRDKTIHKRESIQMRTTRKTKLRNVRKMLAEKERSLAAEEKKRMPLH